MTTRLPKRTDEDLLRRSLEGIVAEAYGHQARVAATEQRRSTASSSYAADVVTVRLESGEELSLFRKDFGGSRLPKDEPGRQRDRELYVYRELLAGANLGTARYYGSV